MRKLHPPQLTLYPDPVYQHELRSLPQYFKTKEVILGGEALREFFSLTELLKCLAPSQPDDGRTIWIEAVRGTPSDWEPFPLMVALGIVSSREEYIEKWKQENPEPVSWWRVSSFSYKDKLFLSLRDGAGHCTVLTNRSVPSDTSPQADQDGRSDNIAVLRTLRHIKAYLENVVIGIQMDPSRYNDYISSHLNKKQLIWMPQERPEVGQALEAPEKGKKRILSLCWQHLDSQCKQPYKTKI